MCVRACHTQQEIYSKCFGVIYDQNQNQTQSKTGRIKYARPAAGFEGRPEAGRGPPPDGLMMGGLA